VTDLVRLVVELIRFLWPFHVVWAWERGGYFVFGRFWREVGPGLYPVLPFFTNILAVPVVRDTYVTGVETIDLKDGRTLIYSATLQVEVADFYKAYCTVHKFDETAVEDASARLSEFLQSADPARLEAAERGKLAGYAKMAVTADLAEYGVRVRTLRFRTFTMKGRTLRLVHDHLTPSVVGSTKGLE